MFKPLVAFLIFFMIYSCVGAQNDQSQRSVSVLNAMWEAGYVTSKIQTPWAEFGKIELAFPKIDVINSDPFRKALHEEYALKKAALKADKGVSLEGLGQQNFNPQVNEDNLIYRSRASAGVQWDLLSGGLLDNQAQARQLDQELLYRLEGLGDNGIKQISYGYRNNVIFYFNKKKLSILSKRKKLADTKIEVLTPLAKSSEIPSTMLLDNYKQMIDIAGQYNLYGSFNESVAGLLDTNKLNLPNLLPPFDINIQALKTLCGVGSVLIAPPTNLPKPQSLLTKEIKFSTQLRYNYYDLITSTTNRNFISLGVNTSIPLRIFSKKYRAYHTYDQSAQWNQKKANDQIQWMEISNLIYEFKYKLKQLGAWEEKQRIQKESLRIYQGLHQINDPSFHPIQALDALDMYYALELEKLDLLQQLYLKLGEIQVKLPNESVNRYIIPYQKQSKPDDWIAEVNDEQFIYTRGQFHSNHSKKGKAQIVIQDAETSKIVGDVSTTTPQGTFEVYFPKPGKYRYSVKLGDSPGTLKGEFVIPDSSIVPAYMDQNVTISKEKNGKISLTIENGKIDSILKGVSAAEQSLIEIQSGKTTSLSRSEKTELNINKTETPPADTLQTIQSPQPNIAGKLSAQFDSTATRNILNSSSNQAEKMDTLSTSDTLESTPPSLLLNSTVIDQKDENTNLVSNNDNSTTSEIKANLTKDTDRSLIENTDTNVVPPAQTVDTSNVTLEKDSINFALKNETTLNDPIESNIQKTTQDPSSTPSSITPENVSPKTEPKIDEPLKLELAMDLNTISNVNSTAKKEKSTGTYSLDIRAAHVIQLVLDGTSMDTAASVDYYQKWNLHSLLNQYPEIAKDYRHKSKIDSLNQQINICNQSIALGDSAKNLMLQELTIAKSKLEWENRNVVKSIANAHNKNLKSDVKKRLEEFKSNTTDIPYLSKQIEFLKNTSDSLLVQANAERTTANNEKNILERNVHVQQAFDDEMNAHKILQHLIMALDSKGVFTLYNEEEIAFLRNSDDDKIRREFKNKKTYLATTDAKIGETFYIKSPDHEKNSPVEKDFFYTVQIGAFKNTFYIEQWEEWNIILGEKIESGLTRVMIGKENTSIEAEASRSKLKSLGYNDAYIVLYSNGDRLPVHEIIEVAAQNDTTLLLQDEIKNDKMAKWERGMYLWSKAYLNQPIAPLMEDLKNWKIDHVIVSPTSQPSNWKQLNPLIEALHREDIGVEWMVGNNKWLNASISGRLDSLLSQMSIWKIKTLHLDIEPHTFSDYKQNKDEYHRLYIERIQEAYQFCKKNGFKLSVSIPLGLPENTLQSLSSSVDEMVLMAYENPSLEAIKRRSQEELNVASKKCIIALRAKDYKQSNELDKDLNTLKEWIPSHQSVIHDYNTYKLISSSNEKR